MKNLKVDSTKILILLILIVIIGIPGRFGFDNLNLLKVEAEQIRTEALNYAAEADAAEREVLSDADAFTARQNAANAAIPLEADVPEVIDALSADASASNLIWLSGSPSLSVPPEGLGGATLLSISLSAPEDSTSSEVVTYVSQFLNKVRQQDRLIVIDRVSLSPADLSANVDVRFFSQSGGQ